jgi:ankyrin repeat protein/truncated hemoglobin YjbI
MTHPAFAHRAVGALAIDRLDRPPARVWATDDLHRAANLLYDRIEQDRPLRVKFGGDLEGERRKLGALFAELFGDAPEWSGGHTFGPLAQPHRHIHITRQDAAAWLGHARAAFVELAGASAARAVVERLRPLAESMVNEDAPQPKGAKREARYQPTRAAIAAASKGDIVVLREVLDAHPHVASPLDPGSGEVLHAAVMKSREEVVRELIARGIDVNKPAWAGGVMMTALCAARSRGKRGASTAQLLREAGAVGDVLTAAYLGELDILGRALDGAPELVHEPDPASDLYRSTVVDHAVLGRAPQPTVELLASRGARSPAHGHALLRAAGDRGETGVVACLLDIGADARAVTPGPWVLHPGCRSLLLAAGADVNHAPSRWSSWIWLSCNGNNGKKDDPALVAALLDAGADVRSRAFGKTALHFAAKAGFAETVRLLLEAGAEPNAVDDDGITPLGSTLRSGPSVAREPVVELLLAAGGEWSIGSGAGDEQPRHVAEVGGDEDASLDPGDARA